MPLCVFCKENCVYIGQPGEGCDNERSKTIIEATKTPQGGVSISSDLLVRKIRALFIELDEAHTSHVEEHEATGKDFHLGYAGGLNKACGRLDGILKEH